MIQGALTALKTSSNISKWVIPDKYYVSFPYGIINPDSIWKSRRKISSPKNFYLSSNEKTVQDNLYASFTFGKEEFVEYRKNIRKGTGAYTTEVLDERGIPRSKLPLEKRWSARFFDLKTVFGGLSLEGSNILEVEFYNIGNWNEYLSLMGTEFSKNIKRPPLEMFSYKEFNPIAKDLD